jgi:hypothetical protein
LEANRDVKKPKRFAPMISASGRDYSQKKGVARIVLKDRLETERRLLYPMEEDELSNPDEEVAKQEAGDDEVWEGQTRRSKRLAGNVTKDGT